MDTPDPLAPSLADAAAPDPFAPVLGGAGAPPPPPLYRKGRDLAALKSELGLYLKKPGAEGFLPDFEAARAAAERWSAPDQEI